MPSFTISPLHHPAAFALVAALVVELVILRAQLTLASARRLLGVDRIYGIAALMILIVGALRVMYFEKGSLYSALSAPFILKMGLFLAIGLLSIYPTLTFLSWRKTLAQGQVPNVDVGKRHALARLVHVQLTLLATLIFCSALMAKGVGFFGG